MAISLNNHEQRIKNAELELPKIQTRIDNLVASGKDWAIVSLGNSTAYPAKYKDYKFVILSVRCYYNTRTIFEITNNAMNFSQPVIPDYPASGSFGKNDTNISCYYRNDSSGQNKFNLGRSNLTVLFYK